MLITGSLTEPSWGVEVGYIAVFRLGPASFHADTSKGDDYFFSILIL